MWPSDLNRTVVLNGSVLDEEVLREAEDTQCGLDGRANQRRSGEYSLLCVGQTARMRAQACVWSTIVAI